MDAEPFDRFDQLLAREGVAAALARLADELREQGEYHRYFDARLMLARQRLGLPPVASGALDDLPEPQRTQLENAYVEECRAVGELWLARGRFREAWMYLRPTGEKKLLADALASATIDEQSLEPMIELALHEGIAPRLGYELVLAHYGTCNAITMLDSVAHRLPQADRVALAEALVRHVHSELLTSLRADIERREGAPPGEASVEALVEPRPELFAGLNYHLDASHLGATVKLARLITNYEVVGLARELAQYGRRLDQTYQYASEAPFEEFYPASERFFAAQLGEQVDEALVYFREFASSEPAGHSAARETYLTLLARLGRYAEAIEVWRGLLAEGTQTSGLAPTLLELAERSGLGEQAAAIYREHGDALNYAAARAIAAT